MICTCHHKCFMRDRIVSIGEALDLTEEEMKQDRIIASFDIHSPNARPAAETQAQGDLSIEEYRRRLDDIGVKYSVHLGKDRLKKMYLEALEVESGKPSAEEQAEDQSQKAE